MSPSGRKSIDSFAPCHRRGENQSIDLFHVTVGTVIIEVIQPDSRMGQDA
jgi:hypothetical protein